MSQRAKDRRRSNIRRGRPLVEPCEPRVLLSLFLVTDTNDSGPGSLRQAIIDSNNQVPPAGQSNQIEFNIGNGSDTQVIRPMSALPEISEPVVVDSTTSAQSGQPIELQGDLAGQGANGLVIDAPGVVIDGLTIVQFQGSGIVIEGDGGDVVEGCDIGVATANSALGNSGDGVTIVESPANTIGGTAAGAGNVITDNGGNGITVYGVDATVATRNYILGNVIGRDSSTGTFLGLGNNQSGVAILGSSWTQVGGSTVDERNDIAGNGRDGVQLYQGSDSLIQGNTIGGDEAGLTDGGNTGDGILDSAGINNSIGGPNPGQANLIYGNGGSGVDLDGTIVDSVQGNTIGLNAFDSIYSTIPNRDGTPHQLGNIGNGILINGGDLATIGGTVAGARNVISGNLANGIAIVDDSQGDCIQENFVGLDSSGLSARGNRLNGIYIASPNDTIGGTFVDASGLEQSAGNVVSGNLNSGIVLSTNSAVQDLVSGNLIGTNRLGGDNPDGILPGVGEDGLPIGNRQVGVFLNDDAKLDTIGGSTTAEGNLISGNGGDGVQILGVGVASNLDPSSTAVGDLVIGNDIGTVESTLVQDGNAGAGVFIYNASSNVIGMPGAGNLIEGNLGSGVAIQGAASSSVLGTYAINNQVMSNTIGAIASPQNLGNRGDGVTIVEAAGNQVGGTGLDEPNLIVGNGGDGVSISSDSPSNVVAKNTIGDNSGDGVAITSNSDRCTVVGNMIGVNALGEGAMGNSLDGVLVSDAGSSTGVVSNLISANTGAGVEVSGNSPSTMIQGNAIGLDSQGSKALGNGVGVLIDGVSNLTVGGAGSEDGNTISGNQVGVEVVPSGSMLTPLGDTIEGNLIGLDPTGTVAVGNVFGVFLDDVVGVTVGGARNVISGNTDVGVQVFRITAGPLGDLIEGNTIGLDEDGLAVPNGADQPIGVFLNSASHNTVEGNLISGNLPGASGSTSYGILIFGQSLAQEVDNVVEGNDIGTDINGVPLLGPDRSPIQDVGVAINASSGNTIGGQGGSTGDLIEGNLVGVQLVGTVEEIGNNALGNTISGDVIDANSYGLFINGAASNQVLGNDISRNTAIGLAITGSLARLNTATGNQINGNGSPESAATTSSTIGDGVYSEGARDNAIVGNAIDSSGLIQANKQRNGVGVYLFDQATGNNVAKNTIQGSSAYGVLLYNSAGNIGLIQTTGKAANTIGGSGIASFREFTGPVPSATTTPSLSATATHKGHKVGKKKEAR